MIKKISTEGSIGRIMINGKMEDYEEIKKKKNKEMENKDIKIIAQEKEIDELH